MFKKMFTNAELLSEAHKVGEIQSKDWTRMMDLVLAGKDGAGTAKAIKDKNKAIARYIAGVKLWYNNSHTEMPKSIEYSMYSEFGEKALELGATEEEIMALLRSTVIPSKIQDKYKSLKDKKLSNRFVGTISKAVLDMGFDIKFLPGNGNAITREGKEAMYRNGRKWTIGYRTEITGLGVKISFVFDAITDEGDGPTFYVADEFKDLNGGYNLVSRDDRLGQRKFLAWLKEELNNYK